MPDTALKAISSVSVGASAEYAVIRFARTVRSQGPANQNALAYYEEVWDMTCMAFAATPQDIAALNEALRDALCRRGEAVTLTEMTGTRTLPAGGVADGCLPGFPVVDLVDDETRSFGTVQTFRLTATARRPLPVEGFVEHEYEFSEEIDTEGRLRLRQSGTYRTANGVDARAEAQTNVIDLAAADAAAAGMTFRVRWTLTPDTAAARYEYEAAETGWTGIEPGVDRGEVVDRLTRTNEGRRVRVVSGFAEGSAAAAYAAAQKPAPDANNILIRDEVSEPSVPDGRVQFTYELLTGVTDALFPNLRLFGFREEIGEAPGVPPILTATYFDAAPTLRYGEDQPSAYTQVTEVEFIGAWEDALTGATGLMDEANLVIAPRRRYSAGPFGLRRLRVERTYLYPEPQTVPTPREIAALA
ncbi:MAG: hypothetical protein BroJett004_07900 [Planctomycetota bacterium]|nr:MAG: hypothetical protein BroJett004_07900 [Planctomycetota bacterium]